MAYFMYYGTHLMPDFARNDEYQKKCFEDMKAHGMTTVTVYAHPRRGSDGTVQTTLEKWGSGCLPMASTMETLMETQLVTPGVPVVWLGPAWHAEYDPELFKVVFDEAQKKNWPDIAMYLVDEPTHPYRQQYVKDFMNKIRNDFWKRYPQYKMRTLSALNDSRLIDIVGEYYDIWIHGAWIMADDRNINKARDMGKELWSYDCTLGPVDAQTCRYYWGFWCWKTGAKGASHWCYADGVGRGRDGKTRENWYPAQTQKKDTTMLYAFVFPAPNELVPSIGWEGVREGIDDYRYLITLKKLSAKARASGMSQIATEADAVLQDIENQIHFQSYAKAYQKARHDKTTAASLTSLLDRPSPQQNISQEDYNRIRYRIAQQIIKLNAELQKM
jgi:hypothetical protein